MPILGDTDGRVAPRQRKVVLLLCLPVVLLVLFVIATLVRPLDLPVGDTLVVIGRVPDPVPWGYRSVYEPGPIMALELNGHSYRGPGPMRVRYFGFGVGAYTVALIGARPLR
jgi:hypothetical protein